MPDIPKPRRPRMPEGYGIEQSDQGLLDWSYVEEQGARSHNFWVTSTRADGRPHAAPVWGIWMNGTVYFSTDPQSTKGRNLAARPEAVIHVESGDDAVIVEGRVEAMPKEDVQAFADAYDRKYGYRPNPDNAGHGLYRIVPRSIKAWREANFPQSATEWRFS